MGRLGHVERPAEEIPQIGPLGFPRAFHYLQETLDLGVKVVHVVKDEGFDGLGALG